MGRRPERRGRRLSFVGRRESDDRGNLDRFDSGAQFVVELRTPGEYAVAVSDGDREEAALHEKEIEKTGITTDMGCSSF